ncbi:SAM-dependent methyltransferase [Chroococcidiopsis sp. CCALA 051]|jgi:caffeoyl-CoA O-methyltransferase|uniref:O-methyltransferase n=1 Tax=Chroococcidiopsis sp. CCALA 051 TaxID=869949 RepID=UPI000D0DE4CA|nr:class I SAM-dependent methyltransferase [Chroococcidiopsis sp. CCALA 051]MBE9017032.1 class I SAM-dependent methyltransferase [Chroococcidiopsidales cyanobacterium LEGE 13417]PSM47445.1 SAM-dependent methyltransferase [Chroococcidiopsis sp. CCALA 051]
MTIAPQKENTARPVTPLGILVQQLQQILELVAKEQNISLEVAAKIQQVWQLAAGIDPYIEAVSTEESAALAALAKKTCAEPWEKRFSDQETVRQLEQEMLSGHLEGQTLKMFVHMTKAKSILEVGMFTGYSALAMAEALPEDGRLVACEVDRYVADFAIDCFQASPHGRKISVEVAPAMETLQKLADGKESFDLVFIDADKKEYVDYFHLLLNADLVPSGGFICVDNTLLQGQPYLPPDQRTPNGEAIAQFNRIVAADPRVEQVLLPLRDGLTIIRRI